MPGRGLSRCRSVSPDPAKEDRCPTLTEVGLGSSRTWLEDTSQHGMGFLGSNGSSKECGEMSVTATSHLPILRE